MVAVYKALNNKKEDFSPWRREEIESALRFRTPPPAEPVDLRFFDFGV